MGKFVASKAVSGLEYDLNPHAMAVGTIPEPSDALLARFSKAMATHSAKYLPDANIDPTDVRKMVEYASQITEETSLQAAQGMAEIYAELTQGKPSAKELMQVPPRIRAAFYGWLQEELNPEG